MKLWLKENWFKLFVIVLGLLYIAILGYEQYRFTMVHNLDVVNSMRLCANFSGEAVQDCADAVKRQAIPAR